MAIKCRNKACPNSASTDDNNFRGTRDGNGPERVYCKACGAEVLPATSKEGDAILPRAPERPLKGDATNLPDDENKEK